MDDASTREQVDDNGLVPGEIAGYVIAVVILVVGGAIARTYILNWIVGPMIAVVSVAIATWWYRRGEQ
jgi:hypothetical protein